MHRVEFAATSAIEKAGQIEGRSAGVVPGRRSKTNASRAVKYRTASTPPSPKERLNSSYSPSDASLPLVVVAGPVALKSDPEIEVSFLSPYERV